MDQSKQRQSNTDRHNVWVGWGGGGLGGKRGMFHNPDYTLLIFFTDSTYFFTQLIVPHRQYIFFTQLIVSHRRSPSSPS